MFSCAFVCVFRYAFVCMHSCACVHLYVHVCIYAYFFASLKKCTEASYMLDCLCHLILQTVPNFLELVKVLSHFCRNPDPEDQIAFDSAVLLGRLCVRDASAEARLMKALEEPSGSHIKAKVRTFFINDLLKLNPSASISFKVVHTFILQLKYTDNAQLNQDKICPTMSALHPLNVAESSYFSVSDNVQLQVCCAQISVLTHSIEIQASS